MVISSSYVYVLLNDFFTAGNGVLTKKKLESKDLGKYGVIFYNAMFMLGPAIIFAWQTGDIDAVMGEEMIMSIIVVLRIDTDKCVMLTRLEIKNIASFP